MKRIAALMLVGMLLAGLCAAAVAEEWTFERGITIVCPWGLGGGADSTIRPMSELLEEYLGVPVEVRNETGGSGVVGATYAYEQPADGYTFLLGTQSLYIQDLLGKMDFDFKDAFTCEDVQLSLQAGMNAHLSKPVEPERLYETLEQMIGRRQ